MPAETPKYGWTTLAQDGSDPIQTWSNIIHQMSVDIENQPFLPTDHRTGSQLPSTYPVGISQMTLSAEGAATFGTAAGASVLTIVRESKVVGSQFLFIGGAQAEVRYRYGTDSGGWGGWLTVAGPKAAVATVSGSVTFANNIGAASRTVSFPAGRFTASPEVVVSTRGAYHAYASGITATGCTVYIVSFDGGALPLADRVVEWIAMQSS